MTSGVEIETNIPSILPLIKNRTLYRIALERRARFECHRQEEAPSCVETVEDVAHAVPIV